jgi:hypothetical protein
MCSTFDKIMSLGEQERSDYREILSAVVARFNEIEFQLTAILIRALELPAHKQRFAYKVLFNNAIIPFAQKVKLLFNLREEMGWPLIDSKGFHRIAHIRNQFAHCMPQEHIHVKITSDDQGMNAELILMLESIDGSGRLKPTSAKDAFDEFQRYDQEVSRYLRTININSVEQAAPRNR